MTGFLIGAALLLAAALWFVLPPLLRKDQAQDTTETAHDQLNLAVLRDALRELDADLAAGTIDRQAYDSARHDLEQRVLDEVHPEQAPAQPAPQPKRTALAVGLMVPVLAAAMYVAIGAPAGLDPAQRIAQEEDGHALSEEQIESMVASLARRMESDPGNVDGWHMLARSYNAMGRYAQASAAYARLVQLVPHDAAILADYADTLAMASNRSLQGEPEQVIERALKVDAHHIKALALYGTAAFERADYAEAIARWQRILAQVPPESDVARSVAASIDEAQGKLGKSAPRAQLATAAPAAPTASVQGVVDLDPALRAQVSPDDTVFIFARATQGPRFPLAIVRKQVKDLPAAFTLDDSMSMTPDVKLSSVPSVVVGARVSRSGNAMPAAGDLEGESAPLVPGVSTAALQIRIDKRIN